MQSKDLLKPEWKYFKFMGRITCVAIILSMLTLISWADIYDVMKELDKECRAGNKQACVNLAEIVKNEAVIGAINDQILLAEIAKTDKDFHSRMLAMNKLSDQNIIANIARNDGWEYMRRLAVEKLTDQTLLADFAMNDGRKGVRLTALNKLTDQALMVDIVKNDEDWEVREAALKKLIDQALLTDIAKSDENWEVRKVRELPDKEFGIIREEPPFSTRDSENGWLRAMAVAKLVDQTVVIDLAKNNEEGYVRLAAADMLNDRSLAQTVYDDLAKCDANWGVRRTAVKKLTNQSLLADIVKNDKNGEVRIAAILNPKLTDQALLVDIAKNHYDIWAYRGAVDKITDQDLLADVAMNGKNARGYAIKKLTNQTLLAEIAKNNSEGNVRDAAEKRLEELKKK